MALSLLSPTPDREPSPEGASYAELLAVVRRVRRRWRARRLLVGAAVTVAAALLLLFAFAAAMDALRYPAALVRGLGAGAWGLLAFALWRAVWRPLRSRRSDRQVALYVEEHDPTLREAVLSGVELGREPGREPGKQAGEGAPKTGASAELTTLVVEEAVRRLEGMDAGAAVETRSLRRAAGAVAAVFGVTLVAALLAPPAVSRGAALLLAPWADPDAHTPYRVSVEPGDAAVATGADQWITARLEGFRSESAVLHTRAEPDADRDSPPDFSPGSSWESVALDPDPEDGAFRHLLLGVAAATDYFVEADGVRSPVFRIETEDVPYTGQIDLLYRYPAYTGLSPRSVAAGGDIAAVAGTEVRVFVRPSVPAPGGEVRFGGGGEPVPLAPAPEGLPSDSGAEGILAATLRLETSGAYRIALRDGAGTLRNASRDYAIEVLDDLPPIVRVLRPGRDTRASPVEEVFTEVRAEDDYRITRLELRSAVNGGEETVVRLAGAGAGASAQSGHTLFLEEWDLVPGDLVSYYAVASDGTGRETASDLFFVAIRPFDRTYRQMESAPGGGGGGGGDGLDGTLSLRQRQVVLATFRVLRDETLDEKESAEQVTTIGLAQGRLREQVATLVHRLRNRGIAQSAEFGEIVGHLDRGLVEMTAAEELLIAGEPAEALPPEQKALTHLQRADAVFREVQVGFGQGGGGGGGGAPPPEAEDLAHLFELEMDRLRNQYETVEQQRRTSADQEVDEVMERLAELARRQEQENERRRRGLSAPGGGAGSAQQRIADETEEAARRLERLARERSLPDLSQVARRLRNAAQDMRSGGGEGLEQGLSAENELRSARRELDGERRGRLGRDLAEAAEEVRRLRSAQEGIRSSVAELAEGRSEERIAELHERKQELAGRVETLERGLDAVGRSWSRDEPEAAEAARGAAEEIRRRKIKEKIQYSRGVATQRSPDYADRFEAMIGEDLEALGEEIERARGVADGSRRAGEDQVLERAESLVRGLEAMRDRLADRGGPGAEAGSASSEEGSSSGDPGSPDAAAGARGGTGGRGGEEDLRQLERELRQRVEDAEALRRAMTGIGGSERGAPDGISPDRLDPALAALRGLSAERLSRDPRGMELLESEVLDSLRQFEFELRRSRFDGEDAGVAALGGERVPEAYREMVEEYFRALSRNR